jgi:hypothetical protein
MVSNAQRVHCQSHARLRACAVPLHSRGPVRLEMSLRRLALSCTIAGDARGLALAGLDSPEAPALHGTDGAECTIRVCQCHFFIAAIIF